MGGGHLLRGGQEGCEAVGRDPQRPVEDALRRPRQHLRGDGHSGVVARQGGLDDPEQLRVRRALVGRAEGASERRDPDLGIVDDAAQLGQEGLRVLAREEAHVQLRFRRARDDVGLVPRAHDRDRDGVAQEGRGVAVLVEGLRGLGIEQRLAEVAVPRRAAGIDVLRLVAEEPLHAGKDLHLRPVQPDALEGAQEPVGRRVRHGARPVAGRARGAQLQPERPLLRRVDPEVERPAVFAQHVLPALRDRVLGLLEPVAPAARAQRAQGAREVHFLVGGGQEEDVAVEGEVLAARADEGHELEDALRLHVLGAAPVDEPVLHRRGEGRHRPAAGVRGHHVHVVGEDEGPARPPAGESGEQVRAAGSELVDLGGDPFAVQDPLVEAGRAQLVAGRVGGVDLEVLAQEVHGHVPVRGAARGIEGGRGQGHERHGEDEGDGPHATSRERQRIAPRLRMASRV